MSEAEPGGREVWIEKYRPRTLADVKGHEDITERLAEYVARNDLPHLLFSGPAGVGKCITGTTPVLTNRGIESVADVVGDVDGFAEPPDGLEVLTFDGQGDFEYVEPSHVYGKEATDLLRVTTRDGNEMTVTPEHQLLLIDGDGLDWTPASEVEPGDRVVRPLRAPVPAGGNELDWVGAMDGDRTLVHVTEQFAREHQVPAEEDHVGTKKRVVAGIRRGLGNEEIAAEAGTTRKTVQAYRRQIDGEDPDTPSTTCSLSFLRALDVSRTRLREHVTAIQYVTPQNRRSVPITPPWEVTPQLARFVGLAVSEAALNCGRIKFYNTDEHLLETFTEAAETVFDLAPSHGTQKGVPYRELSSRTLTHFLESCFDAFDGASGGRGIGSALLSADPESRGAFLRAVFDAEGYVSEQGTIELTQKNERLVTLVSYLLASFAIPSRRTTERKAASNGTGPPRQYHTLAVSGSRNLSRFAENVGFTLDTKSDRLRTNASRDPNTNVDTVPTQGAVDTLCDDLALPKMEHVPHTLNPDSPGRVRYLTAVDQILEAANDRLETAQEVLERLARLEPRLDAIAATPAHWVGTRDSLEPIRTRRHVAERVGVRSDRLLEYADGRRTPGGGRATTILTEFEAIDELPAVEQVQEELQGMIDALGIPYSRVAEGTAMRGTEVSNLLDGGRDLESYARFRTVADRIESLAAGMLSPDVIEALSTLEVLVSSDLYFDAVESVEEIEEPRRVYDLTVPGTRNYVAGMVPTVMHNTTSAVAIARELYGEDWREHFLELNASDERGIDVVRNRIKEFARSSFGGHDYRIVFLDEADALTSDAQSALRRTMEQFSNNTRFVLSCNYSSQIIDPIQSRCAVFRFSPLADDAVAAQVREVADAEGIEVTDDGVEALVYAADGDMRKAINGLQAAAVLGETVDEEAVFAITSTARPGEIEEMVSLAIEGDFAAAKARLDDLLTEAGIAGGDVIDQMHRSAWSFDLDDAATVRLLDRIGEADYRIATGANERVQLEALLASLALDDGEG